MVQVLATIFFSAAALAALGVIVGSFADNLVEVRTALGLSPTVQPLIPAQVRVRRFVTMRGIAMAPAGLPLRAAA